MQFFFNYLLSKLSYMKFFVPDVFFQLLLFLRKSDKTENQIYAIHTLC